MYNEPRQAICRGYIFVYSRAIINQLTIISPLILHVLLSSSFFNLSVRKIFAVERAKADRLGDVSRRDHFAFGEIRDRSCNAKDAIVSAS